MFTTKLASVLFVASTFLLVSQATPLGQNYRRDEPAPVTPTADDHQIQFGYEGDIGPPYWGSLDPINWGLCNKGTKQSPINLYDALLVPNSPLSFSLGESSSGLSLTNDGHTLKVVFNVEESSKYTLSAYGSKYTLQNFHVHTPSGRLSFKVFRNLKIGICNFEIKKNTYFGTIDFVEHRYNGEYHDLELHFVWMDAANNTAVTGVFYDKGDAPSSFLQTAFVNPSPPPTTKDSPPAPLDLSDSLLVHKFLEATVHDFTNYYAYDGSLTVPPCSEGVKWHVYRDVQILSIEQHKAITAITKWNARETQAYNKTAFGIACHTH
ncbi:alpha carbonic anhydrase [Jimgerdemannia flammicorona]|uniref:carbonic anhydrase n=1 Tax=Jimgerdemannia flammicorona TaxID=994334 RepID=A0A433ATV3_9FUNG|nr:alpha carbonic anhydrase [Jimgerdemannia flammicorona]